jgi:hypothetical protein
MKTWLIGLAVVTLVVFAPSAAGAKTHSHKVAGTISSIQGNTLTIKADDGTTVPVTLDAKTQFMRGKATTERSALKVGEHIVAHGPREKGSIQATTVKISKSSKK